MTIKDSISSGKSVLGIEFGSTRIKAVIIGPDYAPVASGDFNWHDTLEGNVWTYSLDDVWNGLQTCYANLKADVKQKYGVVPTSFASIGISGMMHGYIPFDEDDCQLASFRTWRNTITGHASEELTSVLNFNIPQRWTVSHLFQAILNGEEHLAHLKKVNTLAGYVHRKLTGENVVGVGEASGMFPIDSATGQFNAEMVDKFESLIAARGYKFRIADIFPCVLSAGKHAGTLTVDGAKLLDPAGDLKPGVPFCPPEGDAGTGMTATNSVTVRTGNVSAGTSIFSMVVLEKPLKEVHPELDIVTTPVGRDVAMVHCNTCTSDLDQWFALFADLLASAGFVYGKNDLYSLLFNAALKGEPDCGTLTTFNYYSGEPVTGTDAGVPLFMRTPNSPLNLANFMRAVINSTFSTLKIGMDILNEEKVKIDSLLGHGGLFKTKQVGQQLLAAAFDVPVSVMTTAGEGGPWGMALLAAYMVDADEGETLESFLTKKVFASSEVYTIIPDVKDVEGFKAYIDRYKKALPVEVEAAKALY